MSQYVYDAPQQEEMVSGTLTGMEPRNNGFFRFSVQRPGAQWPVRMDTKQPQLVQQAQDQGMDLLGTAAGMLLQAGTTANVTMQQVQDRGIRADLQDLRLLPARLAGADGVGGRDVPPAGGLLGLLVERAAERLGTLQ